MSNCNELDLNLVDYLEGELPTAQTHALDEHVASCDACRESVQDYRQILSAYGELEPEDVPEQIAAEILSTAQVAVAKYAAGTAEVPPMPPMRAIPIWKSALALAASVLAVLALAQLSERDELDIDQLLERGFQREANGEVAGAIEDLERAVELAPSHEGCADALVSIAQLHLGLDDPDSALAALTELASVFPSRGKAFDALILRHKAYEQSGDLISASNTFELANVNYPAKTEAWLAIIKSQGQVDPSKLGGLGYLQDFEDLGYIDTEPLPEEIREGLEALGYIE